MKKAMNQSTMTLILNGVSFLTLIFLVLSLISNSYIRNRLNEANEERFALTYNANRFMNGSAVHYSPDIKNMCITGLHLMRLI